MCRVVSGVVAKLPGLFANSIGSKKKKWPVRSQTCHNSCDASMFFSRNSILKILDFHCTTPPRTMATILDSAAAFSARALEHGLSPEQLQRLQDKGITSLSQLAFALTTPGTSPPDDSLRGLLHDDPDQVGVGQLASIRMLCGLRWPLYRGRSVRHQNYSLISQN